MRVNSLIGTPVEDFMIDLQEAPGEDHQRRPQARGQRGEWGADRELPAGADRAHPLRGRHGPALRLRGRAAADWLFQHRLPGRLHQLLWQGHQRRRQAGAQGRGQTPHAG